MSDFSSQRGLDARRYRCMYVCVWTGRQAVVIQTRNTELSQDIQTVADYVLMKSRGRCVYRRGKGREKKTILASYYSISSMCCRILSNQ